MPKFLVGTVTGKGDGLDLVKTCEQLNDAMVGRGTNEAAIIEVLSTHTNAELQAIKQLYQEKYGRVLGEDFIDELSANFKKLCLYLLLPREHFQALMLNQALTGLCATVKGVNMTTLIDMLCTRAGTDDIPAVVEAYKQRFKRDLKADILSNAKLELLGLFVALLSTSRTKEGESIMADTELLIKAFSNPAKVDTAEIIQSLTKHTYDHLRIVFHDYEYKTSKNIMDAIKASFSGDLQAGLLAIVRYVEEPTVMFAEWFYEAMKGIGTDDERLMWLCVDRCEIDLLTVAQDYNTKYKSSLSDTIGEETSSDYKRLLQKLTTIKSEAAAVPAKFKALGL